MLAMENPAVNATVGAILNQPHKWRALLDQFENVLNLNIFIVDPQGRVLIHLSEGGRRGSFGASFLQKTFALKVNEEEAGILTNFKQAEGHLLLIDPFDLHAYAVPVSTDHEMKPHFYLLVGPIILNKPWEDGRYWALAEKLSFADQDFLENIRSVSQMSPLAVATIMDLLAEVVKDVLELELEKEKLYFKSSDQGVVRPEIIDAARDIFTTIHQDEFLVTILDSAIKMAKAESGSIMIFDEKKKEFSIRVSRGLENKKNVIQAKVKMGEGIAGLAAQGKTTLFIQGTEGGDQLRPFLKRPEIKRAIVVPLIVNDKVIGVLNLSAKQIDNADSALEHIAHDIHQLSRFIATALYSL